VKAIRPCARDFPSSSPLVVTFNKAKLEARIVVSPSSTAELARREGVDVRRSFAVRERKSG
jgi:hypothetical protein